MSRLAIIEPMTLVGRELREALARHRDLFDDIELFTSDPEGTGAVTEVAGRAAWVQQIHRDSLANIDLAIICDGGGESEARDALPSTAVAILIDPLESPAHAVTVVAGVNTERALGQRLLVSPNPAVVQLAHLLYPLQEFGLTQVVVHVLQPASAQGQRGVEELFEQTRAILNMADERPHSVFGTQLAFNLLPWSRPTNQLMDQLEEVVGGAFQLQLFSTQAGVFHSVSLGLLVRFDEDPGLERILAMLETRPQIQISEEPESLGPVTAAATEKILVGTVIPAAGAGYWIWSTMDNLTSGAILNALALVSASQSL